VKVAHKEAVIAKKKNTLVCFVLDETGSMQPFKDVTISGYNEYIDRLRGEKKFSLMLTRLNSASIEIGEPEPVSEATRLTHETYQPDNLTPLYDAVAKTINKADKVKDDHAVLVVILTDGQENASKEYSRQEVFNLIEEKEKEGWQFAYLGANQDAYVEGQKLGVSAGSTINFGQTKTAETFSAMADSSLRYSQRGSAVDQDFFKDVDQDSLLDNDDDKRKKNPRIH
jgi:hypothetical protein